ncbi:hypothetical protein MA16_Dca023043 [Dendrobium catenatum]|uniref:Uncharacterized protein n=1 Tax=Dendrobium catenatum TaxID=906689 RepID=A0A2I0WIH1_9ASPA|nr:hypothetical protein MA16_Dca023043 [Dendrobium catenatum]
MRSRLSTGFREDFTEKRLFRHRIQPDIKRISGRFRGLNGYKALESSARTAVAKFEQESRNGVEFLMDIAHGQKTTKTSSRWIDGKAIDQGIAYFILLVALVVTFVFH